VSRLASEPAPGASGRAPRDPGCPVCGGSSRFVFTAEDRNRRIADELFPYNRCEACSTVFLAKTLENPSLYYGSEYHPFDAAGKPIWSGDAELMAAEAWRVQTLQRIAGTGAAIDIGAGAGGFASAAVNRGFEVTAIEMDAECCRFMEGELGVRAICSDRPLEALAQLPQARVVSLWHVLEHLPDAAAVLAASAKAVEPGGVLAIAVPNRDSIQFRLLRARWAHLDAPRHVCLAGAQALVDQLALHGLEPVLQTTSDPSGLACNLHGWVYALRGEPSSGVAEGPALRAGALFASAMGPIERRGSRGAALTILFRKPA
jgi:SAM-dependent methyltransferase